MKLIIDIPDDEYEELKKTDCFCDSDVCYCNYINAIVNGFPLTIEDKDNFKNHTVEECLCKALKRIKDECSNCKRCSTDCRFYHKYKGCTFCDIPPEYWDCEKITKGVLHEITN